MLQELLHTWMLETRIGENGQQTAPEVGMRNWNGAGGISVPQNAFMNISKPRLECLDPVSRIGTPRSALVLPKEMRGRGGTHTLPVCCVYSRIIPPKIRSFLKPEECQSAPGAAARGGRGGKLSCLCLTTAQIRILQIPTAAACLQDLRNQTKQLKRNPVV